MCRYTIHFYPLRYTRFKRIMIHDSQELRIFPALAPTSIPSKTPHLVLPLVPSTISQHERAKREERDWTDDAEDYAQDILDQAWGGRCIQDSGCLDYVAYCHKDSDIGTEFRFYTYLLAEIDYYSQGSTV